MVLRFRRVSGVVQMDGDGEPDDGFSLILDEFGVCFHFFVRIVDQAPCVEPERVDCRDVLFESVAQVGVEAADVPAEDVVAEVASSVEFLSTESFGDVVGGTVRGEFVPVGGGQRDGDEVDVVSLGKVCLSDVLCIRAAFEAGIAVDFHGAQVLRQGGKSFVREADFLPVGFFLRFPAVPVARDEVGMQAAEAVAGCEQATGGLWVVVWQVSAFGKVVADGVVGGLR